MRELFFFYCTSSNGLKIFTSKEVKSFTFRVTKIKSDNFLTLSLLSSSLKSKDNTSIYVIIEITENYYVKDRSGTPQGAPATEEFSEEPQDA